MTISIRRFGNTADRQSSQNGSVILIVALLIFAIFALLALAIDLVILASAREQTTNAARFASLSALKAYWAAPQTATNSARLDLALAAANRASSLNLVLSGSGTRSPDPMSLVSSADMKLIAGKWYVQATSQCANPCGAGKSLPCFVPLTDVNPTCAPGVTPLPNAFRVAGRSVSRLQLIFSRVFSSGEKDLDVKEVATLTPRILVYLVDLSDSMYLQTHTVTDPLTPSLYSYYLAADNGTTAGRFDTIWSNIPPTRPTSGIDPNFATPQYSKAHYRNDFVVRSPMTNAEYGNDPDRSKRHPDAVALGGYSALPLFGTYRVDAFRNPSAQYNGAEPFRSVLLGLRTAIQSFKERAVVGDKLGIVFYDDTITWPRVFLPTNDYDYLLRFTEFDRVGEANAGLELLISHGIIPSRTNKSNTMIAAREAMRLISLSQSEGVASSPAIVLVGDQLWNCVGTCPAGAVGCTANTCSDNGYYYSWATQELDSYVTSQLVARRIPLHVIQFGQHAGGHKLGILNGDTNKCMTDTEARHRTITLTRPETYASAADLNSDYVTLSESNPFYLSAYNAQLLAIKTTGLYLPILTQDASSCPPVCDNTNKDNAPRMTTQCEALTESVTDATSRIMQGSTFSIVKENAAN